jgi:hypothetical protein
MPPGGKVHIGLENVLAFTELMPMLVIYLEGGSTWFELDFSRDEILTNKTRSTAGHPVVAELNCQLTEILRQRPELFPRP